MKEVKFEVNTESAALGSDSDGEGRSHDRAATATYTYDALDAW